MYNKLIYIILASIFTAGFLMLKPGGDKSRESDSEINISADNENQDAGNSGSNKNYRIMFYNVENLFDYSDDRLTRDDDFTPQGDLHWTKTRYQKKLNNLYKVITATGGWQPPDIIALCETENLKVVEDLFNETPLAKYGYKIIHQESEDMRGIDVALAYRDETIDHISSDFYSLKKYGLLTRPVMHFKGLAGVDTIHLFVNHWPSRSNGQLETERGRINAAKTVRDIVDSLFSVNINSNIIITGDLNDTPGDVSITDFLDANGITSDPVAGKLYNISTTKDNTGTIKYQGSWFIFDQFIVSGSFFSSNNQLTTSGEDYHILNERFLLTDDVTYTGKRPYRTYMGYRYEGGFSDHLPVFIDIY